MVAGVHSHILAVVVDSSHHHMHQALDPAVVDSAAHRGREAPADHGGHRDRSFSHISPGVDAHKDHGLISRLACQRTDRDHRDPDHTGREHRDPDHRGRDHRGPDHRGPDHRGREHRDRVPELEAAIGQPWQAD